MDIGERLRELRVARHLSQGDIEERTGLLRCYLSRVECGHTIPSLETLGRMARAFDLELYQLFYTGGGKPKAPRAAGQKSLAREERNLVDVFRRLSAADQKLLSRLAQFTAKRQLRKA